MMVGDSGVAGRLPLARAFNPLAAPKSVMASLSTNPNPGTTKSPPHDVATAATLPLRSAMVKLADARTFRTVARAGRSLIVGVVVALSILIDPRQIAAWSGDSRSRYGMRELVGSP